MPLSRASGRLATDPIANRPPWAGSQTKASPVAGAAAARLEGARRSSAAAIRIRAFSPESLPFKTLHRQRWQWANGCNGEVHGYSPPPDAIPALIPGSGIYMDTAFLLN